MVVAAKNLEPGAVIQKSDLKMATWSGTVPKGSFSNAEPVVGLTVLQEIQQDEPITGSRVASPEGAGGAALGIPAGMRAVSIQTPDSPGVLRLLRAGQHVDIQVVRARGGRTGEPELRTLLQDVPVLAVPEAPQGRNNNNAVLTVLASPTDAELLSLADAGGRVRVVLRNPLDKDKTLLRGGELASLFGDRPAASFRNVSVAARPAAPAPVRSTARPAARELQLRVRMVAAGPAALEQLGARLLAPPPVDHLQVSPFRPGWDVEAALHEYGASRTLEVLSTSDLRAAGGRTVSVEAVSRSSAPCGIQVHFRPSLLPDGRLRLRVEPEVTLPRPESASTHRIETELEISDGQSFLISGLALSGQEGCRLDRLFPRVEEGAGRALVVLVTPHLVVSDRNVPTVAAVVSR
jgi:pilus assembly protein CpaB